jgi:acetyl esterase/lipase
MKIILKLILAIYLFTGCSVFNSNKYHIEKNVIFKTIEQENLTVDIYSPTEKGLKPAVIVVHGGGWRARSGDMSKVCENLARAGFIAFNITYRLAPKYLFPKPVDDVKDAVNWVKTNASKYQVDSTRLSGWGYSAGAHLILMAGLNPQLGLKSIVAGGTPADLTAWPDSEMVTGLLGVSYKNNLKLWTQASPVNLVETQSPRIFLYHGTWDKLVEVEQMDKMEKALKEKGVAVETLRLNYLGHLAVYFLSQKSINEGIRFLKQSP